MLSKRALGLAMGLAVLPQMVHAGESAARCVDASAPKHAAEARHGKSIELTSEQWQFVGGHLEVRNRYQGLREGG
jgi:hypothetical protein